MAKIIKGVHDFDNYVRGSKVGTDDKVCVAAKMNDENAEDLNECYVVREIVKSAMPITDISAISEHLLRLSNLDHMHVCRFVEAFDTGKCLQLVYERASENSIFDEDPQLKKGGRVSMDTAKNYCRQIVMALSVAHRLGIVHGRLNERSLLVDWWAPSEEEPPDEKFIKICDFGQTWFVREIRKGSKLEYEAPENLWEEVPSPSKSQPQSEKTHASCDMWSFGVIAYRMLTGKLPFLDVESTKTCTVTFGTEWDKMPDAREVVQGLLKKSPHIRVTANRVMNMPWLAIERTAVSRSKMMRVLNNVIQNSAEITFKKFVMRVIAEDMSPQKLEIVEGAFCFIDKNGDGSLQVEEIKRTLQKYLKEEQEVVDAADGIFEAIDRDASGSLNFAEFTAVSIGPQEYCDKVALWECFNRFDKNQNGEFDKEEISVVVKEVEHLAEGCQVDEVVEAIAQDIEMPMDFDAFVQIMTTPSGQPVNTMKLSWDRFCNNVLRVDNHKVRHLIPKARDEVAQMNQLSKSPYRKSQFAVGAKRKSQTSSSV
jgi:calcium-dependent protein kinase